MKVIFLGTPDFAVPTLEALIKHHEVVAVVTQPDKPHGRSKKLVPSPVKVFAEKNNIKVLQYEKIKLQGAEELKSFNADVMVTCAYGQILSQEILDITPVGVLNVHGSILPKYRGAAPIQWAIINGETETGITILRSEVGLDDGDILLIEKTKIRENETSEELFNRLSVLGAETIIKALEMVKTGAAIFTPQNHEIATRCKMLKPEMGKLNFNDTAKNIVNKIHGLNPWPLARVNINGTNFKLYKAHLVDDIQGFAGFVAILLIFVISPLSDVLAFLVGTALKGPKLCPKLSPNKTWAGAIGGLVGGMIGAMLVFFVFGNKLGGNFAWYLFLIVGFIGGLFTILGDLFESAIKRKLGIKDMGTIIPGHGGMLDRIDGISFCSVIVFIAFMIAL